MKEMLNEQAPMKRFLFSMLEIIPDICVEQTGQIHETDARKIVKFHGRYTKVLAEPACPSCNSSYFGDYGSGSNPCRDIWHKNVGIDEQAPKRQMGN